MKAIVGKVGQGKTLYSSVLVEQGLSVCEAKPCQEYFEEGVEVVVVQHIDQLKFYKPSELHYVRKYSEKILFWRFVRFVVDVQEYNPETDLYDHVRRDVYTKKQLLKLQERLKDAGHVCAD